MKELSIEQKARAYDEAIKKLRSLHDDYDTVSTLIGVKEELENIFPELAESEDEMIRKALIKYFSEGMEYLSLIPYNKEQCVAWLEKQGEQKSIWHNEDEEPQRDSLILLVMQSGTPIVAKIIEPNHTFNHGERWAYIDDLLEKQAVPTDIPADAVLDGNKDGLIADTIRCKREKQDEQSPIVDKVEPKFKVGDVIRLKGSAAEYTIKKVTDTTYYTNGWSCGIERCEEDYELVEQKPWSEDDKVMLDEIVDFFENGTVKLQHDLSLYASWLKSIRPQSHWKPSERQIEALDHYVNDFIDKTSDYASILKGLLEQLKAL